MIARRMSSEALTGETKPCVFGDPFMVADDEPLGQCVKQLTIVSQGLAFYPTPERLGEYVIEDSLHRRTRRGIRAHQTGSECRDYHRGR
jgi:uncharacterized protein with von Willebrand factor type A (vWA) domain